MQRTVAKTFVWLIIGLAVSWGTCQAEDFRPSAQLNFKALQSVPLDIIVLYPGDSRSIEFEYDDVFYEPESYHVALIYASAPDNEIHQLTINLTPVGDLGSEIAYFTFGAFIRLSGGTLNLFEFLEPKYTYGYKGVTYTIDVNPAISVGFLFSALMAEYRDFDFPLEMTMTLTLAN